MFTHAAAPTTHAIALTLVRYTYQRQRIAMLITFATITLFGWPIYWIFFPTSTMLLWIGCAYCSCIAGVWGFIQFTREDKPDSEEESPAMVVTAADTKHLRRWQCIFFVQCLTAGIAWSIGPVLQIHQTGTASIAVLTASLMCILRCGFGLGHAPTQGDGDLQHRRPSSTIYRVAIE